ncbi:MAG: ribosome small subunit-dependent GTPase A [Rhodobacterales bacterium]|nr:MAG: ribosome small subunit-dependent GTPase A [Rhodobacterales bacterium]
MTRDDSQLFANLETSGPRPLSALQKLGWQNIFSAQLSPEDMTRTPPVRVCEVHRSGLTVRGDGTIAHLPPSLDATVGDWLLYNIENPVQSVVLKPKSLFKRRAPGHGREVQKIAANVDTVFVVSSCNADFNVARLERYVALAFKAEVAPVIVLTKPDLCEDSMGYAQQAQAISNRVPVLVLNARDGDAQTALSEWCKPGQTVAFLGSSGVGKSTLVNALMGADATETAAIREDDAKGRHTTTSRQLYFTPEGVAILDTPGMRELQLTDVRSGIETLFADMLELSHQCKFRDCSHETEPGCAVRAAVENGDLDPARLDRWRKLETEDRLNSATLAERRARDKPFGKVVRNATKHKKKGR